MLLRQSQGLAQNSGAVRHHSSHCCSVHHLCLSTGACSCPLPLMSTDRHTQTDRHTGSARAPQASEGPQSSSRNSRQQLGQRCGLSLKAQDTLVVLAQSNSQGALLPLLEGHGEGKFWVPFLCPSSPFLCS